MDQYGHAVKMVIYVWGEFTLSLVINLLKTEQNTLAHIVKKSEICFPRVVHVYDTSAYYIRHDGPISFCTDISRT